MSYTGFTMKFPIIRVKDKDTGTVHIVGTDSHDTLYVDDRTGYIKYYNYQCGDGTGEAGSYEFVPDDDAYIPGEIEFVTFDELLEIYKTQVGLIAEDERKIREFLAANLEDFDSEIKKSHDAGVWHT